MKGRKKIIGVCCICLVALLSGCLTYAGQLDTSVPMNEQVTLKVSLPLYLVSVNGNNVDVDFLTQPPFGNITIRLPPGEHKLDFALRLFLGGDGGTLQMSGRTSITYNFEPGYTYTATGSTNMTQTSSDGRTTTSRGTLGVVIQREEKKQSSVYTAIETGAIVGISKGWINAVGLDIGIQPIGFVCDLGKIAFGLNTNLGLNMGWRPLLENLPFGEDMPFGIEVSAGGLFNFYFNQNNGKAFGFGIGGGFTTDIFILLAGNMERETRVWDDETGWYINVPAEPMPSGFWYLRGAIIPNRKSMFNIYVDYYFLPSWLEPEGNSFWNNFLRWGIGISAKF